MKIAPSILSADFAELKTEIKKVDNAPYLHIDIMDGHFVDNLTFGPNVVKALRNHSQQIFDCHLMVTEPEKYLEAFAKAGADIIGVHVEATPHIHRALSQIKGLGVKAEVVINPGTPVAAIKEVLPLVDQVLVMTVDPGFGGQAFLESTLGKIKELAQLRLQTELKFDIEVDGGINTQTIKQVAKAGADVAVAGSFVFNSEDPAKQVALLKEATQN